MTTNNTINEAQSAILILPFSRQYVVAVGETGFKSTTKRSKATRFPNMFAALNFASERGIFRVDLEWISSGSR